MSLFMFAICSNRVPIPRLSELFSELTWRVVNGALPAETVVNYLASDVPFENKLSPGGRAAAAATEKKKGDGEKLESSTSGGVDIAAAVTPEMELQARSVMECLCDTLWGVEAMVRGTVTVNFLERLADNREWGRLCTLVSQLRETGIVPDDLLLSLLPVGVSCFDKYFVLLLCFFVALATNYWTLLSVMFSPACCSRYVSFCRPKFAPTEI